MDWSKVQLQNSQAYFADVTNKLTKTYDEEASQRQPLEVHNNTTQDVSHDNKILRDKVENVYKACQDIIVKLALLEQHCEIIEQQKLRLEEHHCNQDKELKEQAEQTSDEKTRQEKRLKLLKQKNDEYRKFINERSSLTNEVEKNGECDNISFTELDLSDIFNTCEKIKTEFDKTFSLKEDTDKKIKEGISYVDQKVIERKRILEDEGHKDIYNEIEQLERDISAMANILMNKQLHKSTLENTIESDIKDDKELEMKLIRTEKEQLYVTETTNSTLRSVYEDVLLSEVSITKRLECVHEENNNNILIENELKVINDKILSNREDLSNLQRSHNEELQGIVKIKQTTEALIEGNSMMQSEVQRIRTEIENVRNEPDMREEAYQVNMKELNAEILKANEDSKSMDECMNEKLKESQRKVTEYELQNKDIYEYMTNLETSLKDIEGSIIGIEDSLDENHKKMKCLDIKHENISTEVKVLQLKKSNKNITPKVPYSHFILPAEALKVTKSQKPKPTYLKNIPDNMSDTSTEGESIPFQELRRRSASRTTHKRMKN